MENKTLTKILDDFDFETVHNYMKITDWKWYNHEWRIMRVPSLDEIRKTAEYVLELSYETNECIQTGGFVAICYPTETGKFMGLFFSVVAEYGVAKTTTT